jgi:calcineurin-like phosphoesterase family protein
MLYFLSDTHFGNKPIGYCRRKFTNIEEIDNQIINNINKKVKINDTLYFLGDFCHKGENPKKYRDKIVCNNIHIILGNHDLEKYFKKNFKSVSYIKEITHSKQKIILCHYPMRAWHKSYRNTWMLYGHVHGRLNSEDQSSFKLTLDVGVDNTIAYNKNIGEPWSFKELKTIFSNRTKNCKSLLKY